MIIYQKVSDIQRVLQQKNDVKNNVGFVPTMGALHQGHITLIKASKANSHFTVASIFVNPTQFNDAKDFAKYPVTIENDVRMLEAAGCDVLFLPSVQQMYPNGTHSNLQYELGNLEELLEGFYRPGHYQGVCQVVHRLLDIIKPDHLYMGQKDYQQCMVIQYMINSLSLPVTMHIVPTIREASGLAMSSRNMRLTEDEKITATAIYSQLNYIKEKLGQTSIKSLKEQSVAALIQAGFKKVDYVEIADASTLQPLQQWQPDQPAVILAAAFLGDVRLIDNVLANVL